MRFLGQRKGIELYLGSIILFFSVFVFSIFNSGISSSMNFIAWSYYLASALGHAFLIATVSFLLFYIPLRFIFTNKNIAAWVYAIVNMFIQAILILDSLVFNIYKFHFNGFVWELLTGGGADQIFVFSSDLYIKFFLVIFVFVILPFVALVIISRKYNFLKINNRFGSIAVVGILCLIVSHLGFAVAHAMQESRIQKSATALPWFFPLTANSLLKNIGLLNPSAVDSMNYNQLSQDLQYPLKPIEFSDSVPNYNIVYLILDSWNPTVFTQEVMPNVHSFGVNKGQVFTNHMSSNYATRGGIFGLFFGLSFTYEREFNLSRMSPLLIDRLVDLNYDIQAFPSASITNPPFHEIIFRRVPGVRTQAKGNSEFERDNDLTETFVDYLDNRNTEKPFFAFLFYDILHNMIIPKEYPKKFTPSWDAPDYLSLSNDMDRTPFFNLYKNCAYYEDILMGKVLNKLEEKGLLDSTIIVIAGDHGQEFNENKKNYWGHSGNYSKWQLQTPFIIYYPDIVAGKSYSHMTTHYDVSPTILKHYLGVESNTQDYSMGYDLWDTNSRYPHIVGDHVNYAFVLHNAILKTGHAGGMDVTDLDLNPLSRDSIDIKELKQVIDIKNKFYK